MSAAIETLEKQYHSLRELLSVLGAKGASEDQLEALRDAIAKSRDNYYAAANSSLQDDDPEVATLISQMKAAQVELDNSSKELAAVSKVLNVVTKGVAIGSQLAAKVAVL